MNGEFINFTCKNTFSISFKGLFKTKSNSTNSCKQIYNFYFFLRFHTMNVSIIEVNKPLCKAIYLSYQHIFIHKSQLLDYPNNYYSLSIENMGVYFLDTFHYQRIRYLALLIQSIHHSS